MKTITKITVFLLIFFASQNIFAATNYVSKTGAHISPFTSWANAATNIQAAVNVAAVGDIVLVNDGTYYPSDQINIIKNITLKSVNNAEKTIVDGCFPKQTNRCFYISKGMIDGFTITNGKIQSLSLYDGGGVMCSGGIVQNCIIGNCSGDNGGGAFCNNGGAILNCFINNNQAYRGAGICCSSEGIITNCIVSKNIADNWGGGVYCRYGGEINNCIIRDNEALSDAGGGIFIEKIGIVRNCIISNNYAYNQGGGIYGYKGEVLNSIIINNKTVNKGGGISGFMGSKFKNCIINENSTDGYGGGAYASLGSVIQNCTISKNSADVNGDGVACFNGGFIIQNTIIWNNGDTEFIGLPLSNSYNCIQNWTNLINGIITNDPQFISTNNFHLQSTSPCKNAGTNMSWMWTATDLDGNPRIIGGTVDMGAYEFVPEPVAIYYLSFIIYYLLLIVRKR